MTDLKQLVDTFMEEYKDAPLYGGYSRTLRKKIASKQNVKSEFISNLQMLSIITDDQVTQDKITAILKKFEQE